MFIDTNKIRVNSFFTGWILRTDKWHKHLFINKICGILSQVIKKFILGTVYLWTWLVSIWFTASVNLITLQQILCPLLGTIRRCVALVTPTYLYASRIGTYWPCTRKRISGNCRKSRLYFRSQIVCVVILQIWWRCSNLQNWNDAYDYFWKLEIN